MLTEAVVAQDRAGWLELTPDDNPLVGWTDLDNLYTAAGFSGHGLSLAPGLAPEVAREVQGLPASLPLAAYRPDRFSGSRPADDAAGEAPEILALR